MKLHKGLYKSRIVQEKMERVWNSQTSSDFSNGINWYPEANSFCNRLAIQYNIEDIKVAGILAALSPQQAWKNNQILAESFLKGRKGGHYRLLLKKAEQIKNLSNPTKEEINNILRGLKITNFFNCIYNPNNKEYVTVDRHHLKVAVGTENINLTPKFYNFLKEETIKFSNKVNLLPNQAQGILWCTIKRTIGNNI